MRNVQTIWENEKRWECLAKSHEQRLAVQIAAHAPHLRAFDLQGEQVNDADLALIVASCPHIIHLNLQRNVKVTDDGIKTVTSGLKLRSIAFTVSTQITCKSFEYLAQHCGDTLREVHLMQYERNVFDSATDTTATSVQQLKLACNGRLMFTWKTNLSWKTFQRGAQYTSVGLCCEVTDLVLGSIAENCKELQELSFLQVYPEDVGVRCTEAGVRALVSQCPELRAIYISKRCLKTVLFFIAENFPGLFITARGPSEYNALKQP